MNQEIDIKFKFFVVITFVLAIWSYLISHDTLFNFFNLLIVIFILGILSSAILTYFKLVKNGYEGGFDLGISFISKSIVFAVFLGSIILLSNFYIREHQEYKNQYEITGKYFSFKNKTAHNRGSRVPVFIIDYNGQAQSIEFSKFYTTKVAQYKFVEIKSKKGFWGWHIIVNKEAIS